MQTFRIAEVAWGGKKILYIITNSDIMRNNQAERIFGKYQNEDTVVIISVEDQRMCLHYNNGEIMQSFLQAVDTTTFRSAPDDLSCLCLTRKPPAGKF